MANVLLDASVCIDLLRERPGAVARLRALQVGGDRVWTCAVVADEVVRGLRAREATRARELLFGLYQAPLGVQEGWQAGEWRRSASRQGKAIAQSDTLIAASAASIGATIATGNPKDFAVAGVRVEHWPVNE